MALGSSTNNAAGAITGGGADGTLDFVSFDLGRPGSDMDVMASVQTEGGRRFSSLSWSPMGADTGMHPYGILAGGMQDGIISLWSPYKILQSKGADNGLLHSSQVHNGTVNCVEFHPGRPSLMATCGADSEVYIMNIEKPQPDLYKPSETSKHAGSEVLCCAWNRKVQHILCSCSNVGTTVVWDLKAKKEVINFKDPASRMRCSGVAWHPEVPTQLLVAYDDDRNPSMQMWDLRNCQCPFMEKAGHTKGILGVAWNSMDPNLLVSCGKDNRALCWCLSSDTPEIFSEVASQNSCFEVKWAQHKPSLISAASLNGVVSVHSVQQQQKAGVKYCPRWYSRPCGNSFGFGGKVISFGLQVPQAEPPAAGAPQAPAKPPTSSWCQSIVVPNDPEVVPMADVFEQWIAESRLQEYCRNKTSRAESKSHESLMWELMATQFDSQGRQKVPAMLGFQEDRILQEAERFLGQRPGTMLQGPTPEQEQATTPKQQAPAPASVGPVLGEQEADLFFMALSETNEKKQKEEEEREQQKQLQEAMSLDLAKAGVNDDKTTDWSSGPEALIKQSLLVGNLAAAVECCFKSGRMAEGLLLASGGGTTLFARARDEYLRLQGDVFLSTVGNIMTRDFEKLVANSNLSNWMETLAIIATYANDEYQHLCELLAERLQEAFDVRSAVICYICARNFPKTVSIWANTHIASSGSQKLALQDLVEKMAVLQEATKFNQQDPLFNAKLIQYAEILANSGRLTAAMRYLCLLRGDTHSAILRDRIYNCAPRTMSSMFGGKPQFPFEVTDVRIVYQPPVAQRPAAQMQPQGQPQQQPKAPTHAGVPGPRPMGPQNPPLPAMPPNRMVASGPAPTMPANRGVQPPGPMSMPMSGMNDPMNAMNRGPSAPSPSSSLDGGAHKLPPRPNVGGGMNPAAGVAPPSAASPYPNPGTSGGGVAPPSYAPNTFAAPTGGSHVLPPGQYNAPAPAPVSASAPPPGAARPSTAPTFSAMPVVEDMPVAWPLPTSTQSKLSKTSSVAEANRAVQSKSAGAGGAAVGEPMEPHDLTYVQNVLSMLLEASAQDGNMKKREDNAKRLDDLYTRLQGGHVRTTNAQKVLAMVKAVEAQDYTTANKLQTELCSSDWDTNKYWLTCLKRLIPAR